MITPQHGRPTAGALTSKLNQPTVHAAQLPRDEISASLQAGGAVKLVLVQGPAGFGKSTLLAQSLDALAGAGTRTAWLTLDEADNDIQRFMFCLEAAIANLLPTRAGEPMTGDDRRSAGNTALSLIAGLANHSDDFVLFLDDFERVQEPTVLGLVREIIDHLPPNCRLVIGSRSLPDLRLARLRTRGQLVEIDSRRLRFSLAETEQFLNHRRGLALSTDELTELHAKTEGWIAALWLASLALDKHPAPGDFIARFSGEHRAVADYLAEDVLAQQPQRVRKFLLRTSILRYLSVPLCNVLLPDSDNASLIDLLNEANVFLVPIESEERLYRYHSLFSDFLRHRLTEECPDEIAPLHRAASAWFEAQQRPVPAIDHALEGGDYARALALMSEHAEHLLAQGRMRLLGRWFDSIPAADLAAWPLLQAIHVWALCFSCSPHTAMEKLEQTGLEQSTDPRIRPHALALRPSILAIMDDFEQVYAIGSKTLAALPAGEPFAETTLVNTLANAYSVMGEHKRARTLLDGARDVQGVHESAFNAMFSESVEGIIDLQEGRQRQAAARFRLAARITWPRSAFSPIGTNGNAWAGVLHASAVYESNDLDTASRLLNVYAPLARHIGLPDHMILADVMLARIAFIEGDIDKALQTLTVLERTGHNRQLPRVVATSRLHRAQLMLLQGDEYAAHTEIERASDPTTWDRLRHLRLLANDVDNDRIGQLRWAAFVGNAASALRELERYVAESQAENRHRRAFKLRLLQAVAQQRDNDLPAALNTLEQALKEGCREGYIRLVLDEGPRVGALVVRLQADTLERKRDRREPLFAEYLQSLLQGFGPRVFNEYPIENDPNATLIEPLTRKEIRVLKLLAEGNSNSAMAEKLFVSDSTIRTHLRNINGKLNASNRTEAVAIARKVGVV